MAYFSFNASEHVRAPGEGQFDPIPEGWYPVTIKDATIKGTKRGDGEYIHLKLEVFGPSYSGRIVFAKLNVRNPNSEAERIAHLQLGDILRAIGKDMMDDTDELLDRQIEVKVIIKPKTAEYEASNDVKGYRGIGAGDKKKDAALTEPSPPPAPAATAPAAPPWAKK